MSVWFRKNLPRVVDVENDFDHHFALCNIRSFNPKHWVFCLSRHIERLVYVRCFRDYFTENLFQLLILHYAKEDFPWLLLYHAWSKSDTLFVRKPDIELPWWRLFSGADLDRSPIVPRSCIADFCCRNAVMAGERCHLHMDPV